MIRKAVGCVLCVLLSLPLAAKPLPEKIRENLGKIPTGGIVEVTPKQTGTEPVKKFKGRLTEVRQESFTVQVAEKDRMESREQRIDETQKVRDATKDSAGRTAGKVGLGILAGVGVLFVVALLIVAAGGGID
jgi:hypothetical protein